MSRGIEEAAIVLADGTLFEGEAIGGAGPPTGSGGHAPRPAATPEVGPRIAPSAPAPSRVAAPGFGPGGGSNRSSAGVRTAPPPQTDKAAGAGDQQDQAR